MSDAKRDYSDAVIQRKREALIDEELGKKISNSFKRRGRFVENWEAVDINIIVARIAPNSIPVLQKSKIIFYNDDMSKAVVADISGYFRVQEDPWRRISKSDIYLDLFGNDAHNYTDERGKQHGAVRAILIRQRIFVSRDGRKWNEGRIYSLHSRS